MEKEGIGKKIVFDIINKKTENIHKLNIETSDKEKNFDAIIYDIQQSNFKKKETVYIDIEVHEVFHLIKKSTGINMGDFFSYLGEKLINDNKEAIFEIINTKNKYLKK